ncbi:Rieske (2Fe-2S) protein [Salinarimonas ramus]|uniref:Rieske domain-containing protein n=1 Tax=Salinarimonas ramus TaxID=690164 RepID=A0A917Q6T4_9HYPH|nr:Rieske (2Fe-2S) protein [Salinarimonas ramus]GGK30514.1 hypothetical protein GCM10011322_16300 [Salinarimonas ramus]
MRGGWCPIGLSQDLPAGIAAPVILDGRELVAWRTGEGVLRLFEDRCPHRGMRLSFGFVRGDALVCLYHGWRWGADGGCRAIPAHPELTPPKSLVVPRFAVREAGGLVWAALGDGPDDPPPETPADVRPLATLAIDLPADVVSAALGAGEERLVEKEEAGFALLLAIQPVDARRSSLHVLLRGADASPLAALDAAEALRMRIEREGAPA